MFYHISSHKVGDLKEIKIFVAEDYRSNQRVISFMLKRLGYEGRMCDNGVELIEQLKGSDCDLILMDLQMPKMGGLEATRLIRNGEAGEANKDVKILALTANVTAGVEEECLDGGMDGFLTKPITPRAMDQAIKEHFPPAESNVAV